MLEWPQSVRLALHAGLGETLDSICGGEVQVLQRRTGYRFTLDPILLAHFAVFEAGAHRGRLIDLGTGSGIIPLILAKRLGRKDITALELQPRLYSLAERNVYLNRCEQQVTLVQGDLRQVEQFFAAGSFSHVLCNPPYRACATGRSSLTVEKAIARHEVACSLPDVVRAARHLLAQRGGLCVVYPSARFAELAAVLREHRLEPRTMRMVHPRADRPAKLVLLHAVKGGRADLTVLPPLVLHAEDEHAFTEEVSAMVE
ncbi:tRNA1(Val) (adenine(37)-N6)-methyltransferase [Hyalangium rubrum]|uniref:tRNA1(Val) (Adenine(37)-N6)-methyltransferase n=1 Tax=Hyalangium rubrum TaxID=3103134 RepID=A0ABU5H475_9BACT|nr:tRNA1(Val) (adenine(37)-N6)-methyltransferase [Hyalangium sp. s54d21]MDY7228046.1 tRNA1(Val) (adenine(37)-N6)-methyltransferase [Hyalangium sp. s54d21]